MEFFFTKNDGLYQIFKLLEKLPSQRNVEIFIDPEHGFFDNLRWGQQVKEIIDKKRLNITFRTQKDKNRKFYLQAGLKVNYQEEKQIVKFFNIVGLFFTDIKRFHLQTFDRQKYLFFLVFFFELLAGVLLLWFLVMLVVPKATIIIHPAQQNESVIYNFRFYPQQEEQYLGAIRQISIPYYTGMVKYHYEMNMGTANIKYIQSPSRGLVNVYNKSPRTITLVPNTRFVTNDKLIFLTKDTLILPSGSEESPSETKVILHAAQEDENGEIIGMKGNIEKGTSLLIRNLKESYYLKEIWGESLEKFEGGKTTSTGSVTLGDIKLLENKIKENIYADKLNIVRKNFRTSNSLIVAFDSLVKTHFDQIHIPTQVGEDSTEIKGIAQTRFDFYYLLWADIYDAFKRYVYERPSDNRELVSIDQNSFAFIEEPSFLIQEKVFMVPVKINILQSYDFNKDPKNILNEIKDRILGADVPTARKHILDYPEIGSVEIKISNL